MMSASLCLQEVSHRTQYCNQALQSHGPPKLDSPADVLNDETSESRSCDGTKKERRRECLKSSASLVQVEYIYNHAGAQDGRYRSEHAAKQTRDGKGNVLILASHTGSPYTADESANETPEDERTPSELLCERNEKERTISNSRNSC